MTASQRRFHRCIDQLCSSPESRDARIPVTLFYRLGTPGLSVYEGRNRPDPLRLGMVLNLAAGITCAIQESCIFQSALDRARDG